MKRYRPGMEALRDAVLETPGASDPDTRRRVFEGRAVSEDAPTERPLETYLGKIESEAYRITDEDVDALRAALTEDAIFELTLAAALRAAWIRFEVVEDALR